MQLILMVYSMIIAWLSGMWAWLFWRIIKYGQVVWVEVDPVVLYLEFGLASLITILSVVTVAIMARRLARSKRCPTQRAIGS